MKKTFTVEGTEYTVEEITAIATCAGEYSEDDRGPEGHPAVYHPDGEDYQCPGRPGPYPHHSRKRPAYL